MNGYLLDTNVVSETVRSDPHRSVVAFLTAHADLWLPSILIHELEFGLQRLPRGRRRAALRKSLHSVLTEYEDRILSLDRTAAEWAARFRAQAHRFGQPLQLGDALIAGTAKTHDLTVATRNVKDFASLDVDVIDPWIAR